MSRVLEPSTRPLGAPGASPTTAPPTIGVLLIATAASLPWVGGLPAAAASAITVVGAFSNMRYTQEHAYGYEVQLWRENDRLLGLFLASEGLAGDTPTGLLEDVEFDPKTGKVAFRARLTIGTRYSRDYPQGIPSCFAFRFSGVLGWDQLAGMLERSDVRQPGTAPVREAVALRRGDGPPGLAGFATWREYAAWILTLPGRGPRC